MIQAIRLNMGLKRAYRKVFRRHGITSPIVVHTMAHDGTTTISQGLKSLRLDVPIYHTHVLNYIDRISENMKKGVKNHNNGVKNHNNNGESLEYERSIREQFEGWHGQPWNFISLVRDPVARNISAFFYEIEQFMPDFHDRVKDGEFDVEKVRDVFFEIGDRLGSRWEDTTPWFDRQVRDLLGIDVFATAFPKEAGYAIYEGRNSKLLLLRLESLQACSADAFRQFLGIASFRPVPANSSENKHYRAFYDRFKREVVLSDSYLEKVYGSQLARHFYTEQELQRFKAKWLR